MELTEGRPGSSRLGEGLALAAQIVLTLGISLGGFWAIVGVSGQQASLEDAADTPRARARTPVSTPQKQSVFPASPPRAVILVVSDEAAKESLVRQSETETLIRTVSGEPPRQTWVVVIASDESIAGLIDAVEGDNRLEPRGSVAQVQVVDLR